MLQVAYAEYGIVFAEYHLQGNAGPPEPSGQVEFKGTVSDNIENIVVLRGTENIIMSDEYTENMSPSHDGIPLKLRIETDSVNDEVFSLKENVVKAISGQ